MPTCRKPLTTLNRTDQCLEEKAAQAEAEQIEADAADALQRLHRHADEGLQQSHQHTDYDRGQHAYPQIVPLKHHVESKKRAHQHDAVNAQVQYAGALAEGFA